MVRIRWMLKMLMYQVFTISNDHKKVSLTLASLKAGYVYELNLKKYKGVGRGYAGE